MFVLYQLSRWVWSAVFTLNCTPNRVLMIILVAKVSILPHEFYFIWGGCWKRIVKVFHSLDSFIFNHCEILAIQTECCLNICNKWYSLRYEGKTYTLRWIKNSLCESQQKSTRIKCLTLEAFSNRVNQKAHKTANFCLAEIFVVFYIL